MRRVLVSIAAFLASCGGPPATTAPPVAKAAGGGVPLRNVDVTIVYPLPRSGRLESLLAPSTAAHDGELLTRDAWAKGGVPVLDAEAPLPDDDARIAAMRVLALRYDPCAGVVSPPADRAACHAQLRLVFQQLTDEGGHVRAQDGAVHAFYALDVTAAAAVERELRAMRAEHPDEPTVALGVSPRLVAEGLDGPYARRWRTLLTTYLGPANLVRVTHFRRVSKADWVFAIRERHGASFTDGVVATTDAPQQFLRAIVGGRWDADMMPKTRSTDDPTKIFEVPPAQEKEAFRAVVRVLNPRIHGSETIDCGSCHVAPDVAVFVEQTRKLSRESMEESFRSTYQLDAVSKSMDDVFSLENLHMLSYLGTKLTVSPRVANETAVVLELLNR